MCEYGNKINVGTEKVCAQKPDDTEMYIQIHIRNHRYSIIVMKVTRCDTGGIAAINIVRRYKICSIIKLCVVINSGKHTQKKVNSHKQNTKFKALFFGHVSRLFGQLLPKLIKMHAYLVGF